MEARENYAHAGGGGYSAGWFGQGALAEPLDLEEISPLVFSEIMRDVDLFVGVASVGNDPTWSDGGPEGRFRDYWTSYSFGDLSEVARTRKQVLERLIPRLKIADRCRLTKKFLVVEGDVRTYKIHLGSGNILMEPNDQYLCIVPARGMGSGGPRARCSCRSKAMVPWHNLEQGPSTGRRREDQGPYDPATDCSISGSGLPGVRLLRAPVRPPAVRGTRLRETKSRGPGRVPTCLRPAGSAGTAHRSTALRYRSSCESHAGNVHL